MMTPKFAPVGPLLVMRALLNEGPSVVGDYHLLLAHEVLADPTGWRGWVNALRDAHRFAGLKAPLVIMDNSIIELGHDIPMKDIMQATMSIAADVVVLPDIIGEQDATNNILLEYALNGIGQYDEEKLPQHMFVPQGQCLSQYVESIEFASTFEFIDWIGLPRDALEFDVPSRRALIDAVEVIMPYANIHLLGMSNDPLEDVLSCRFSAQVRGIDSAVPIRAGLKGMPICLANGDYGERGNYWEAKGINLQAVTNLQYMREKIAS